MRRRLLSMAAALMVATGLLTVPATAAQAVGNCVAGQRDADWGTHIAVLLMRTSDCRYYARLQMDGTSWGVGLTSIQWRVERLEFTSYGWYVTQRQTSTTGWRSGAFNTATVDGWYPTAAQQDRHQACFRLTATSGWDFCTSWMDI
jgi:hypothetical protein